VGRSFSVVVVAQLVAKANPAKATGTRCGKTDFINVDKGHAMPICKIKASAFYGKSPNGGCQLVVKR
jgi:hypothetical protein